APFFALFVFLSKSKFSTEWELLFFRLQFWNAVVGKVNIELDEVLVDSAGQPGKLNANSEFELVVDVKDADRVQANEYKLLPNHEYVKDPTVTVLQDSEESYVRMLVTINKADELDKIFAPGGADMTKIFKGYDGDVWIYKGNVKDDVAGTRTYEFRYYKTVNSIGLDDPLKLEPLFETLKVPSTLNGEQLDTLTDEDGKVLLQIDIVAQAIQADGFANADAAWAAFPTTTTP
ncbi:MAG: hypothetical protein GX763_02735, partial [Clostridiaceae bacterium]|nr:hypothetical protein [Clostridiaceae bacterium]